MTPAEKKLVDLVLSNALSIHVSDAAEEVRDERMPAELLDEMKRWADRWQVILEEKRHIDARLEKAGHPMPWTTWNKLGVKC